MREQEVRELYEAYMQVHQPQEEVERLDEEEMTTQTQFPPSPSAGSKGKPSKPSAPILPPPSNYKKKTTKEETNLFDTILEHLIAEGYADTNESALAIMANMSEEWRQSIVEAYQEPKFNRKAYLNKLSKRGGMGMGTPDDPHGYRDPKMAKVGAEFSKRKTAAAKARKTGEPDKYRAEKEAQSKNNA
jgi:hypothetical protein